MFAEIFVVKVGTHTEGMVSFVLTRGIGTIYIECDVFMLTLFIELFETVIR